MQDFHAQVFEQKKILVSGWGKKIIPFNLNI